MTVKAPKPTMLGLNARIPVEQIKDVGPRFWKYVRKNGPNGCWECERLDRKGYGRHYFGKKGLISKEFRAHRFLYFVTNPTADQSLMVLHRCDNRRCVNPDHMFLGTAKDNADDMISKGRAKHACGEANAVSRFTTEQILKAKELHASGLGYTRVGRIVGISKTHVRSIIKGRAWAHLGEVA